MYKNTKNKQHQTSTCSAEQGGSPMQFYAMNSIYELQSIINKLSIEKQRDNIEYANSLNLYQKDNQRLKHRLQGTVKDKQRLEQQLQHVNKQAHAWKNKADEFQRQKNQMQKMLLALSKKQSQANVELQTEYQKLKTQLQWKTQEIGNLQLTIAEISGKQLDARTLNNEIKANFQQKIKNAKLKFDEQHTNLREQIKKINNQKFIEHEKFHEITKQLKNKVSVLTNEKQELSKKLLKYRKQIHEIRVDIFNNEHEDVNKPINQAVAKGEKQYKQLEKKFNEIINQNTHLIAESKSKAKQLQLLQSQSKSYTEQISILQSHLSTKNETQMKFKKILQQKQSQIPKLQPTDRLAQLQQLNNQFTKSKQMLEKQVQTLQKRCNCMKQIFDQSEKQKIKMQERLDTHKYLISEYQNKYEALKAVNRKLQIQLMQQKSKADTYQYKMKQIQLINRRQVNKSANQNIQVVSADKYYSLLQGMNNLSSQKTKLLKQNIQLQSQLQKVQDQLILGVKHQKQLQFQIQEQKRKFSKLYADKEECMETIHKLQMKINKNQTVYNEDRAGLVKKIQIFSECVGKIKKQKQIKKHSLNVRPLSCDNKVLQLKIKPPVEEQRNFNITALKNPQQIKLPIKQNISKKIQQKFRNFEARRFLAPAQQKNQTVHIQQSNELKSQSNTRHSSKQLKKRITFGGEPPQNLQKKKSTQNLNINANANLNTNINSNINQNTTNANLNKKIRTQLSAQKISERIQYLKKSNKELTKMKQF